MDKYVGGAEHATMHLLYARFITKALRDAGHIEFDEPFFELVSSGNDYEQRGKNVKEQG